MIKNLHISALAFSFALLVSSMLSGQNLVRNCKLENISGCPNSSGDILKCDHWLSPGNGTPDFVHACNTGNYSVPNNIWGNQSAHSGNAYFNIILYSFLSSNREYREYVTGILDCEMQPGQMYDVSFYVSLSDKSHYAIDGMGAHFTNDIPVQSGSNLDSQILLGGPPHISNPDGQVLSDKVGWHRIHGVYTAQGGEKFITIGNYKTNAELTIDELSSWSANISSYYIDDIDVICLQPIFDLGPDTTICPGSSITFDVDYVCSGANLSWEDGSTDLIRTISEAGTYSIGGFIGCSNFTDEITISFPPDPGTFLPPDSVICPNKTIEITADETFEEYQWQDGSTLDSYITDTEGDFWLEVKTVYGCYYTDSMHIDGMTDPYFQFGNDTLICMGQEVILDPGIDSSFHNFLWHDNSHDLRKVVGDSGEYWLRVSNPCGEISDTIWIWTRNCDPTFLVPNAFTPNADGLNDVFRFKAVNIHNFRMYIYDRWGRLLYETEQLQEGWDGKLNGEVLPAGTYVWMAIYDTGVIESLGETKKESGTVVLLR